MKGCLRSHLKHLTSFDACGITGEGRVPLDGEVGTREDSTCSHEDVRTQHLHPDGSQVFVERCRNCS